MTCFTDFEINPKMSQDFVLSHAELYKTNQVHVFSRALELNFPYLVRINCISFKCTLISQFIKIFYVFSSLFPFFADLSINFLILFSKILYIFYIMTMLNFCQFLEIIFLDYWNNRTIIFEEFYIFSS